jgi:hypothetical protein
MAQPEFPIGFVERFCPLVRDAYRARNIQNIGTLIMTQEDLGCAECDITINCGWLHCESCGLFCAPDCSASVLYRKQIEDYYEAAKKKEQADDVSQQAQEGPEVNPAAELAASIGEVRCKLPEPWSWVIKPHDDTTGTEGQEGGKAVMEEKLSDEASKPVDEIKKHLSMCAACEHRKQQTFATLEGERVSLASKEELLARLKLIVEDRSLYAGWATQIGKVIDLTDLTKEQAALLYFELKEYGYIKTRRPIHGGTDTDD